MATHNELGRSAEALALREVRARGYRVLASNWRYARWELDIVAERDGILQVFEVKSLRRVGYIFPEQRVTRRKLQCLMKAIDGYLYLHPVFRDFRLHIISIIMTDPPQIDFFEDVYLYD